jgi:predicted alpha/beta-hydrolase family hydrolase
MVPDFSTRETSDETGGSYKLEESKVKLGKDGETSVIYAVPAKMRDPSTSLVIAHGAGGPMHSPFIRFFHTELAKQGFLAVKFNFPYMEARKKVPDRTPVLEESYQTIIEEVRKSSHQTSRIIIGGKSMGGRIASQVAANGRVDVNGLFFLGYPLHPPGKTEQLRDTHLYGIRKPMLFLSGTRDNFARKDLLERVVAKIGSNAQLNWIENGDHSFKTSNAKGNDLGASKALTILLGWLESIP